MLAATRLLHFGFCCVHGSQGMGLLPESGVSSSLTTKKRTRSVHVAFNSPTAAPDDLGVSGFARTATADFYASLNDGSEAWLGLYCLSVHDGVAEWIAVDAAGNFENGIRIFGSSGDDIVYARVAWRRPKKLEFSAMPPKMPAKLLLNADHRHRESHSQPSF